MFLSLGIQIIFTQNLLIKNVILVAAGVEKRDKISLNCYDFSVISSTARYGFLFFSPIFDRNFLYFLISLKSLHFNIILFVMFWCYLSSKMYPKKKENIFLFVKLLRLDFSFDSPFMFTFIILFSKKLQKSLSVIHLISKLFSFFEAINEKARRQNFSFYKTCYTLDSIVLNFIAINFLCR